MRTTDIEQRTQLTKSMLFLLLAVIAFVFIWIVGAFLFALLDQVRGLGNDKLQALFREVIVPGLAGFAAMTLVRDRLERFGRKVVFFGFSAALLVLIGIYLGMVAPIAGKIGVGVWDIVLAVMTFAAGILGAYLAVKNEFE
jgi:hypothetical protein